MELIYLFVAFGIISLAILIHEFVDMYKEKHVKKT